MLSGSANLIKYLLFIFNLIFVITGIAILSVGAVIQSAYSKYENLLDGNFFSTPGLLIAIGVIIFVVAFFGCCGSIKENYCMVLTFAALMIFIFILELAGGIAGYALKDKAGPVIEKNMLASMPYYLNINNATVPPYIWSKAEWDGLQTDLACCGVKNASDWMDKGNFPANNSVPESCCMLPNKKDCNYESTALNGIYKNGCLGNLGDFVRDHAIQLGGAGIGIAIVQIFGVVLSCALAKGIKNNYETV